MISYILIISDFGYMSSPFSKNKAKKNERIAMALLAAAEQQGGERNFNDILTKGAIWA